MKKQNAFLFCVVLLVAMHSSIIASGDTYQQRIEDAISSLRDTQRAAQYRITQLQKPATRSLYSQQELEKLIQRKKRTLSQLKRTHARLLLKQAEELAQ